MTLLSLKDSYQKCIQEAITIGHLACLHEVNNLVRAEHFTKVLRQLLG